MFLDSGRGTNGKYVRINDAAALRSRNMDQATIHKTYVDSHIKTPNECRMDLDLDPIEGGDEFPAVPGAKNGTEEQPADAPAKPKVVKADSMIPLVAHTEEQSEAIASARLNHLAAWVASELLTAEARDLAEIAKTTATDSGKWAQAVSTYFGRRADVVAQSLSITKDEAKAYCKEQARIATDGGAKALDSWAKDHAGRVVDLALGTKE